MIAPLALSLLLSMTAPAEGPADWTAAGRKAVAQAKALKPRPARARNVVLFIGDGMGITTVTAARILDGQRRGESGEGNLLSFEKLPNVALSKTYSANQQTPDSAPTMTAIITGVKTNDGFISVDQRAKRGDAASAKGKELLSLLALAEKRGLSTGVVTTARLTHATPAACYAHSPDREWESDADLPDSAKQAGWPDIARQFVEFPHGDGLEVALGGGRAKFTPKTAADPEHAPKTGERLDGRDLPAEWTSKRPRSAYVWDKKGFDAVDAKSVDRLLGLFERSHMNYEHDRPADKAGEPSLAEMASKAVSILSRNPKGWVLMVEGGRIDHSHHGGNAYRALTDTIAFSDAVAAVLKAVNLDSTLVIVTADHSHVLSMSGYPARGNPILGKAAVPDESGKLVPEKDLEGLPYTTLNYANGPGFKSPRADLTKVDTTDPDFKQPALFPYDGETHGGEDVAIYADGPGSGMIRGVMEQNAIFHVMTDALGWTK